MITSVCMVISSGLARVTSCSVATIIQSGRAVLAVLIVVQDGGRRKFNIFKELRSSA